MNPGFYPYLPRHSVVIHVCAWCGLILGAAWDGHGESHGVCPECFKQLVSEI